MASLGHTESRKRMEIDKSMLIDQSWGPQSAIWQSFMDLPSHTDRPKITSGYLVVIPPPLTSGLRVTTWILICYDWSHFPGTIYEIIWGWLTFNSSPPGGWHYKRYPRIKSGLTNHDFLMWILIVWQLCWQPVRSCIWKSWLVIYVFILG